MRVCLRISGLFDFQQLEKGSHEGNSSRRVQIMRNGVKKIIKRVV